MNTVIFGANGRTGRLLTRQALNKGHTVTAVTRHPAAFPFQYPHLRVVAGDLLDTASVDSALAGQDAVLCVYAVLYSFKPMGAQRDGVAGQITACSTPPRSTAKPSTSSKPSN